MPAQGNGAGNTHINGTFVADSALNDDRGITVSGNVAAFSQAAVDTSDTCAASCHSDGGSWQRLWSTAADSSSETLGDVRCNVCHGYLSNWRTGMTVDHNKPAINNGTHGNCSTCHVRPNAPYTTAATYHNTSSAYPDANAPLTELTAAGRAIEMNNSVGYDNTAGNCNTFCHGATPQDATHTLGTSSNFPSNSLNGPNANCNSCHFDTGGAPAGAPAVGGYTFNVGGSKVGAHGKHAFSAATAYGDNVNHSTDLNGYDYGCGICHSTNANDHLNATLDLKLPGNAEIVNGASANFGTTTVNACSGVYCHSDGVDLSLANAKSPTWTGTFSNPNGDYCQNCHGNQPTTSSHARHTVGIHSDDVYTGTSGLLSEGAASNGGHGDVNTALTITCAVCHNSTTSQWYNGNNSTCVSCHGSAGPATDKTVIITTDINEAFHVNGIKDVAFAPVTALRSKAQVRDFTPGEPELDNNWQRNNLYKAGSTSHDSAKQSPPLNTTTMWNGGTKNCTVACHFGNTATWGTTGVNCNYCHTQLPK
jgi:predicted CxxxxCH...CXXCH cytochrome family protein